MRSIQHIFMTLARVVWLFTKFVTNLFAGDEIRDAKGEARRRVSPEVKNAALDVADRARRGR